MIQAVYDWIKNIILFMTGMTIILNLISKNSYRKYAKFISGILLIIFIIKPIISLLDKSNIFGFSIKSYEYMLDAGDSLLYINDAEDLKNSAVIKEYKKLLAEQTEKLLNQKGLRLTALEVEIDEEYGSTDFGSIKAMYITAGYKQEESEDVKVPDIIIEQIVVSIGEDKQQGNGEESRQGSSALEINVKNSIADFYNLDASHINIIIREDSNG